MSLSGFFKGPPSRNTARDAARMLYDLAVAQARQPAFYAGCGVPDTVDGRFDMISLHVYLLLHRFKAHPESAGETAQSLFDTMFEDMDRSLREMGAGDLGVGRRVKAMARAFYGRIAAYDTALEEEDSALELALRRNLYRDCDPVSAEVAALAAYVRHETASIAGRPRADLLAGQVEFSPAPAGSGMTEGQNVRS